MFSRHVGIAFALQGVVFCLVCQPPSQLLPKGAVVAAVAVEVQPLDLAALQLADFGDVEPAR